MTLKFNSLIGKFAFSNRKFATKERIFIMYRDRLVEIIKEKQFTVKRLSEESGVSIDTISRITHPENPEKDSPRVNTLEDLCKALGIELWEIFYLGDRSFISLQAEMLGLKNERDNAIMDNAVLKDKIEELRNKVDELKDELIAVHKYYMKLNLKGEVE